MTNPSRALLAIALAATASCTDRPAPSAPHALNSAPATVVVAADTVLATRTEVNGHDYVSLEFPLSVTNTGTDTLSRFTCSDGLEARVGKEWRYSGGGGCFLIPTNGSAIPPGETREFRVSVHAVLRAGPYAEFAGTLPGEFRYRVGLRWTGLTGTIPAAVSNTFVVVLRQ